MNQKTSYKKEGDQSNMSYFMGALYDKMIFSAGITLVCLGVGFLAVPLINASLSNAFTSGGYLCMILGGITAGFGVRVSSEKQTRIGSLK